MHSESRVAIRFTHHLPLMLMAATVVACGGSDDDTRVTMAKDLAVAPPQSTGGQTVFPQMPAPGTAAREVNALKASGVNASEIGCSSYSIGGTGNNGWPQYVVLVDVSGADAANAEKNGYYEVRNGKDLTGTKLVETAFACSTRNL